MSHDRPPGPATDQHSRSADDTTHSTCTTRAEEGPTGYSRPSGGVAFPQIPPGLADTPWSAVNDASTHVLDNNTQSLTGRINHFAAMAKGQTSSFAQDFTSHVDCLDPSDLYSLNDLDAESWSGPALQAMSPDFSTSNLYESAEWTNRAGWALWPGLDQRPAPTQPQQHLELSHLGVQFSQFYPESMNTPSVLMTPELAQQPLNNEYYEWIDGLDDGLDPYTEAVSDTCSPGAHGAASSTISDIMKCPVCLAEFRGAYGKRNYKRHRQQKHTTHRFELVCEIPSCSRVFVRQDARLVHYRRHHPQLVNIIEPRKGSDLVRYRINTSDETRSSKYAPLLLTNLLKQTSGDSETVFTDTASPTPTMVTRRLSTEVLRKDGAGIRCDICQKEFNRAAELRRHKDSVHNLNPPQYFCEVPGCDRASRPFPRKDKLADHTARVHDKPSAPGALEQSDDALPATYPCDYPGCEREFDQNADLLRHKRTHTDKAERPHKCAQCAQSFLYPKDLKRHRATHLDNEDDAKPSFHCEVASCDYGPGKQGFSRKDGMIRHRRRFHPELIVEKEET